MGNKIMKKSSLRLGLAVAASAACLSVATPASARGCNGVINPLVWGCAPWDNNNGPNFPYFKKTQITIPKDKAQIVTQMGVQMVRDLRTGAVHPLIGQAAGNIIARGGQN